jgi:hypothetical protein
VTGHDHLEPPRILFSSVGEVGQRYLVGTFVPSSKRQGGGFEPRRLW